MGESTVDAPKNEDKMGGVGGGDLEVSISFGRFENDSLSWERWSSFSQNKYLEEVEKCSTPGSVAMKKAYFEAHYKKVAAKKAELMDQQAQTESDLLRSDNPNGEADSELYSSNDQCFAEGVMEKTSLISEESSTSADEPNEDAAFATEIQSSSVEEVKQLNSRPDSPCLGKPEEAVLVKEKTPPPPPNGTQAKTEISQEFDNEIKHTPDSPCLEKPEEAVLVKIVTSSDGTQNKTEISQDIENEIKYTPKIKKEIMKQDLSKKSKKTTAANKERNVARVQKKPVSPLPKRPQISSPGVSRPTLASTPMSAARSSTKKGTNSSLPGSKNSSTGERRRGVPSSIHMSLSFEPRHSDPACPTTTRKSLIMEKMGDKDIVKRAFKTFQNNVNQLKSPSEEKSSLLPKQVQRNGTDLKVSSYVTPRKDKDGSHKAGGVEGKGTKTVSSSPSLRSIDRAETKKKFLEKLDEKSNSKEAYKTHLQLKSKVQKETEIKKLRQSLNFKATPLPDFYRGQQLSKSLLDKDGSKNDALR